MPRSTSAASRSKRVTAAAADLREQRLQLAPQRFADRRCGLLLVEHAPARGLEGGRERSGRLGHIGVGQLAREPSA